MYSFHLKNILKLQLSFQVRIQNFGLMDWQPTGVFETSCDIDVTYYPFDTQVHICFS